MNPGITRWKIVPSYSGTPCLVALLTGFFQSFVPEARPIKFATPMGALSGNSVHVILPAVVSMMAVGLLAVAAVAGLAAVLVLAAGALLLVCPTAHDPAINRIPKAANVIRMIAPWN